MREIKFRIWDKRKKEMGCCFSLKDAMEGSPFDLLKTDVIMQFTGLRDKNGKEIYEGDIITAFDQKRVVDFTNGVFSINEYGEDNLSEAQLCEVIGNIYENPELKLI